MISFNCRVSRFQSDENGVPEVIISVPGIASQNALKSVEKRDYQIKLYEIKSQRSIQQNNLMWSLIDDIAIKTGNDAEMIYLSLLENAGQGVCTLAGVPEVEAELKKAFRIVKTVESFVDENGGVWNTYRCYIGSSKMNSAEMSRLLDETIKLAAENEIYINEIEEL